LRITESRTFTVADIEYLTRQLPPVPDDVAIYANPLDIAKGLLGFTDKRTESAAHPLMSFGGIPVCADKAMPEGKAALWNRTKGTATVIYLEGAKKSA